MTCDQLVSPGAGSQSHIMQTQSVLETQQVMFAEIIRLGFISLKYFKMIVFL